MTINFLQIQEQIQRDISKNDLFADQSDYGATALTDGTIAFYVKEAIRYFSRLDIGFNQETATLTADGTDVINPPSDFVRDIEMVNAYNDDPLVKKTLSFILKHKAPYNGDIRIPEFYTFYKNQFKFPDNVSSGETFTLFYVKRLPELVNTTDTNEWLNAANAPIRARAMGDILAFKRKSMNDAQVMYALADDLITNVLSEYADQQASGTLEVNQV